MMKYLLQTRSFSMAERYEMVKWCRDNKIPTIWRAFEQRVNQVIIWKWQSSKRRLALFHRFAYIRTTSDSVVIVKGERAVEFKMRFC